METNKVDQKIGSYLTTSTFNCLPLDFKKGFVTWNYDHGDRDIYTYDDDIEDWNHDPNVSTIIKEFEHTLEKDCKFKFGFVPTNLIIERLNPIVIEEYGCDSFEEWHESYQSTNDADHGDSLFPIIIGDEYEWIYDGWHRLNYYLSKNIPNIPVISEMRFDL